MRSDRELLELAATAAGMNLGRYADGWNWSNDGPRGVGVYKIDPNQSPVGNPRFRFLFWNPLVNDGDALRLAVKLGIERIFVLRLGPNGVCVDGAQEPRTAPVFEHSSYRVVYDHYAATRRAIVRAAAEIAAQHPRTDGGGHGQD